MSRCPHIAWAFQKGRELALTGPQRLVLLALSERANGDLVCWPSVATLEEDTGLKDRAIRNVLYDLERLNLIHMERRRGCISYYHIQRITPAQDAEVNETPRHQMPITPAPCAEPPRHVVPTNPLSTIPKKESVPEGTVAPEVATPSARVQIWSHGLEELERITGKHGSGLRALMGKLLKKADDDCAGLLAAIRRCPRTEAPIPWLAAAATALSVRTTRGNVVPISRGERLRRELGLSETLDGEIDAESHADGFARNRPLVDQIEWDHAPASG